MGAPDDDRQEEVRENNTHMSKHLHTYRQQERDADRLERLNSACEMRTSDSADSKDLDLITRIILSKWFQTYTARCHDHRAKRMDPTFTRSYWKDEPPIVFERQVCWLCISRTKYANNLFVWYQRAPLSISLSISLSRDSWQSIQGTMEGLIRENWGRSWQESTYVLAIKSKKEVMNIHM